MKNFEKFANHVVKKWGRERENLLGFTTLNELSNREHGDLSEIYVKNKIHRLIPKYKAFLSKGSRSPSDIFSFARRNGYWHIMLIQVKSSITKEIYTLNESDLKEFELFTKFFINEIKTSSHLKIYKGKPIVISIGYAGILSIVSNKTQRLTHKLSNTECFKIFKLNTIGLNQKVIKDKIIAIHRLTNN